LRDQPLRIGMLIFSRMDQIDFTGPFAVLSRLPNAKVHVIGVEPGPVRDHLGMILTADVALAAAPPLDILHVPGGPGQEAVMANAAVLDLIRRHAAADKPVFSVCTGALICGAAGILRHRRATTHWASFELLPYFGAIAVRERVVLDGNVLSTAGVTAGLDGALRLAALVRDDATAQRIQLDIQYAPEPPFHAGLPETAPRDVVAAVTAKYQPLTEARLATARRLATQLSDKAIP
jgi:cyclohexyl-isocyanide hydratase